MYMAAWPNGKALDYESRDCRFDPCCGHSCIVFYFFHTIVITFADRLVANNILLVVTVMELKYFTRSPVKS
jgi:hypothetical protein